MKYSSKLFIAMLTVALISSLTFSPTPVHQAAGADGTTGTIQMGFSEYIPGNSYIIVLKDLTVSADYTLAFTTGCATNITFATGATETELSQRVTLEAPTSGSECLIEIVGVVDMGGVIDSIRLQATELTDIINQDEIIDNLMVVLVIMVVVGLVMGIYKKMS